MKECRQKKSDLAKQKRKLKGGRRKAVLPKMEELVALEECRKKLMPSLNICHTSVAVPKKSNRWLVMIGLGFPLITR